MPPVHSGRTSYRGWGNDRFVVAGRAPRAAAGEARIRASDTAQPRYRYAAARSRAIGPTTALWHAVELHRPADEVDGACELSVCGVLARIVPEALWPTAARDVCSVCVALAH